MKKFLSLFLTLLFLLTLTVSALAEEIESGGNAEISEESSSEDIPPSLEAASAPAPAPEPEPEPAPAPELEPEAAPAPALPEAPVEDQMSVETSPVDLDDSGLLSGPGDLDAPTYDVTETPADSDFGCPPRAQLLLAVKGEAKRKAKKSPRLFRTWGNFLRPLTVNCCCATVPKGHLIPSVPAERTVTRRQLSCGSS